MLHGAKYNHTIWMRRIYSGKPQREHQPFVLSPSLMGQDISACFTPSKKWLGDKHSLILDSGKVETFKLFRWKGSSLFLRRLTKWQMQSHSSPTPRSLLLGSAVVPFLTKNQWVLQWPCTWTQHLHFIQSWYPITAAACSKLSHSSGM